MRYFIKMNDLEENGTQLRKYAYEVVAEKINQLLKLQYDVEWQGYSYKKFSDTYTEKITELYKIAYMLDKFGYFMEYAAGKYNDANEQGNKEWKNYDEMLEEMQRKLKEMGV